ncbi:TPA: hypothetical protein L4Q76_001768 [Pseudomonas aeruginosa]|uniref:hypothetical protein n=1 Tax=Pseudomonas aeruginosa TaxID=287 RepID=UPI0004F29F05|nr:hypothetical protein [Pseudomonas aeruginosa]MBH4028552.1 hypothetical protein [Pseudomonas aeruginosa]MBV5530478.1 hypothetical protein [Pseudomonas aeruginosa]MCS8095476.1 hypothetical protein [Pseudomonas aeruginosa]RTS98568.1 hypothetical protein DY952_10645 [Pseudomonas aeruginosa]HBO2879746.1 hypothetical protein [Pseudomonas aeruginosa]
MGTIRLQTKQNYLIANLWHAFTVHSMLGEPRQKARLARARHIHVTFKDDTLTIGGGDNGIADLQILVHIVRLGRGSEGTRKRLRTVCYPHSISPVTCARIRRAKFPRTTAAIIYDDGMEVILASVRVPDNSVDNTAINGIAAPRPLCDPPVSA